MLLIDGVKYKLWTPKTEDDLERMVKEHAKDIFGGNSLYLDLKQKLKSPAGIGSIPDGYVITFEDKPRWHIVEVELSTHPLYEHIVSQITRFTSGIANPHSQRVIIDAIDEEIRKDEVLKTWIKDKIGSEEIYKFVANLISDPPVITIIIDEKTEELEEVCHSLPGEKRIVEFKTFESEEVGLGVHAHLFEPLAKPISLLEEVRKCFTEKKPKVKPSKVFPGFCYIPTEHKNIHTEWLYHGEQKLGVELHIERANREENSRLLGKIQENKTELEKSIGEQLIFDYQWLKKKARIYAVKETKSTEELKQWAVETMVKFYGVFNSLLDEIDAK